MKNNCKQDHIILIGKKKQTNVASYDGQRLPQFCQVKTYLYRTAANISLKMANVHLHLSSALEEGFKTLEPQSDSNYAQELGMNPRWKKF